MEDRTGRRSRSALVRAGLALAVGVLWIGPVWEGFGVLWDGESFGWGEAVMRGVVAAGLLFGLDAMTRRSGADADVRSGVNRAVARGVLPADAEPDSWLGHLARLRASRRQDRVAFPVLLLLVAGLLAAAAVRGDEPGLWWLAASALAVAPLGAVLPHRQMRTADRLAAQLEERAVRD